jgi:hypothetical protein
MAFGTSLLRVEGGRISLPSDCFTIAPLIQPRAPAQAAGCFDRGRGHGVVAGVLTRRRDNSCG